MTETQNLLSEYVQNRSDAAFGELVARYVDLVYSTAFRLVAGDTHRAKDVSQIVFLDLARMAPTLSNDVKLGGWLHRHTCFVASTLNRGEHRRHSRERQAAEMYALQNHSDPDFSLVAPILDEAINELDDEERMAILLRFFERQDLRSVGQALGSSEDAARMRVTRALDKLHGLLKRRGVSTSAGGLALILSANAVQSAPVNLAFTISTAAALAATATTASSTTATIKTIVMTTMQKSVITAVLTVAAGAGIFQARQASQLREQNQRLQQEQKPLTGQTQQLQRDLAEVQRERDDAIQKLNGFRQDNERLNRNATELLRLRGEVAQLKAANAGQVQADPIEPAARAWLARINELKQRLEESQGKIPELQFLNEKDWLEITANTTLDSDADVQAALGELRKRGDGYMVKMIQTALQNYMGTNNGQWPTEISQLTSYFSVPVDESMLQRWEIVPTSTFPKEKFAADRVITEKAPVDARYDSRYTIDGPSSYGVGPGRWPHSL